MDELLPLGDISSLLRRYAANEVTPSAVIAAVRRAMENDADHIWIHKLPLETLIGYARTVEARARASGMGAMPLYGIPFAIKDNIDLAGAPTTAACPAFTYTPRHSAAVVQRLLEAGAIPVGKTNLDQFATGLNGTRSPYGACRNAFDSTYISGGSSSGSAVALAKGMVCFALGTDTAGSGRVPAAFNNVVGYKPTKGWLSTRGVVPVCRSLDCVSIFAFTAKDAKCVLALTAGYDPEDIYSRKKEGAAYDIVGQRFRFGIPHQDQLRFFGNFEGGPLFREAVAKLQDQGGEPVEIDFDPFMETARLLYEGPWVAERYAAIQSFFEQHSDQVMTPVREIIEGARRFGAADAFNGLYRLRQLKRLADQAWTKVDCLLTPTAGALYTIEAMQRDPIQLNADLGYYTNFMNLLDYCAVAVPAGFQKDGLPFGVTVIAPAHQDEPLLRLAGRLQQAYALSLGATGIPLPFAIGVERLNPSPAQKKRGRRSSHVRVAVCGAHLSGLPLNGQLTCRKGHFIRSAATSADYKLYALPGGPPYRPGLVRVNGNEQGTAVEIEVWELPAREFGGFVADIPPPLGIGTITLADGEAVQGFLCEHYAVAGAVDISRFGGWRAYLERSAKT
jgi:allophanate hydrolase